MKPETYKLFEKIFKCLEPPPDITLTEWADKYRYLSKNSSAEPGKWRTDKAPYQKEIMNAISDLKVKKVVVMCAAQIGKTDGFILNTIGYYMHYDPSPVMVIQPTIKLAEGFSKERIAAMLRDTPVLKGKVNDKTRNGGNTILYKEFPGGLLVMVGANAPSDLRSRPIRILLADEIDAYPPTAGKEGDPLLLASKRLTTFWNKKEVMISTPTVRGASRISVEFENSTQEIWHVPCPGCGEYQELTWAQVSFDKNNPDDIDYICIKCGAINNEYVWKERFTDGKFVPRYPEREVRGFHLNSLASLFVGWKETVEKFLTANEEKKAGNTELLKVWTNTEMGQVWEEEGSEIDAETLYRRREKYNCEVPDEVICLTAGVDTQDDRFEVETVGWGEGKESWGIKYQVIYGDLKQKTVWDELDAFLNQTFTKADGTKLKIIRACVDSGGHYFNEVCAFCKTRFPRILAVRGRGGFDVPYIPRPTRNNRLRTPLFTLGVDTGKALLYQSLLTEEEGANYCHFPKDADRGYGENYFKGLTAERMILTYKRGKAQYVWKLKQGARRNEPLDVRNYAQAALEISGVVLKKEKDESIARPQIKGRRIRSKGVS